MKRNRFLIVALCVFSCCVFFSCDTGGIGGGPPFDGFSFMLQEGDFWEFWWSQKERLSGETSADAQGYFTITLGAPVVVSGVQVFPLEAAGELPPFAWRFVEWPDWEYFWPLIIELIAEQMREDGIPEEDVEEFLEMAGKLTDYPLLWEYIGLVNNRILARCTFNEVLADYYGSEYDFSVLFDARTGRLPEGQNVGFFRFVSSDKMQRAELRSLSNEFIQGDAVWIGYSEYKQRCEYYMGEKFCETEGYDRKWNEYYMAGIGPAGFEYYDFTEFTSSNDPYGYVNSYLNDYSIWLVASSLQGDSEPQYTETTTTIPATLHLIDHVITDMNVDTYLELYDGCATPKAVDTFTPSDAYAFCWFSYKDAELDKPFVWRWYGPDGALYAESEYENPWGSGCLMSGMYIKGYKPASMPGEWHVDVSYDGGFLFRETFTITE